MAHGVKDERRPADVIAGAARLVQTATGERDEYQTGPEKNLIAVELGRHDL